MFGRMHLPARPVLDDLANMRVRVSNWHPGLAMGFHGDDDMFTVLVYELSLETMLGL